MRTNKGKLIPNIRPLSFFESEGARSPYDGELCYDDETYDLYYWAKNDNNVWTKHSRTEEIQEILDGYGEDGDNTFQNAQAFYDNEVIHRFFYNQIGQKVWLDNSIDISKYAYYAILSIGLDKGVHKYITGLEDSDGTDYTKALIPTSLKCGTLTKFVTMNTWYTVEFYNSSKEKVYTVNYLSYQSSNMPIDIQFEDGDKTNTVTNVKMAFDQLDSNGDGVVFTDQDISVLNPKLQLIMADGHTVEISDDIDLEGLDDIDVTKPGDYTLSAKYSVFNSSNESVSNTVSKNYKEVIVYLGSEDQTPNVKVVIDSNGDGWYNRIIKTVEVLGVGNEDYVTISDYTTSTDDDGNTAISIPNTHFKIERNVVRINYTEDTDYKMVETEPLKIQVYGTVHVQYHEPLEYSKFYPVGYVEDDNGTNVVKYKFYVLTSNGIKNITDNVTVTYPDTYTSNIANRLVAKFYDYEETFFSFFRDINQSGSVKRVLTSTNQSDLLNNPDEQNKPVLIYANNSSDLTAGQGTFDKSSITNIDYLLVQISDSAEYIRVRSVKTDVGYISDFVNTDSFTYTPGFSEFTRFNNPEELSYVDVVNNAKDLGGYSRSYRLVKYKNVTIENTLSTRTLKELLQTIDNPTDDFGTFIGYSVTNDGLMTEEQENETIELGAKIHIFAYFAKDFSESDTVPKYFGGLLEVVYTLKKYSMRASDPFLVEGYSLNSETNKYTCLGAVVCHASTI